VGAVAYEERYSYEDYKLWEGEWELIDGNAYAMSPSPMVTHQSVAGKIYRMLDEIFDDCPKCLAAIEMDWNISDDTVVKPDVMVVCNQEGERVVKTPEIIFEVISKNSAKRDEILKFALYQDEGVKYYGVVYPEFKKVRLFVLDEGKYKKVGDFTDEKFEFVTQECRFSLSFERVWRAIR